MSSHDFVRLIPDFRERFLKNEFVVFLAVKHGIVVGAAVGTESPEPRTVTSPTLLPAFQIVFLNVSTPFRGHGVGKALFTELLAYLRARHYGMVTMALFQSYASGFLFFEKLGFQKRAVHRGLVELELPLWDSYGVLEDEPIDEI